VRVLDTEPLQTRRRRARRRGGSRARSWRRGSARCRGSGRSRTSPNSRSCAARRGLFVPMRAPSAGLPAQSAPLVSSTSCTTSRGGVAAIVRPAVSAVCRSLKEWTAKSTSVASRAFSRALTKAPTGQSRPKFLSCHDVAVGLDDDLLDLEVRVRRAEPLADPVGLPQARSLPRVPTRSRVMPVTAGSWRERPRRSRRCHRSCAAEMNIAS
jgi:hypothetical protein